MITDEGWTEECAFSWSPKLCSFRTSCYAKNNNSDQLKKECCYELISRCTFSDASATSALAIRELPQYFLFPYRLPHYFLFHLSTTTLFPFSLVYCRTISFSLVLLDS
eukprot:g52001.t1